MIPARGSFNGGFPVEAGAGEVMYALMRAGEEGYMVIDGPDDHITTVASVQEAWQFSSHQGATLAARTLSRWSRIPVEVVRIL